MREAVAAQDATVGAADSQAAARALATTASDRRELVGQFRYA